MHIQNNTKRSGLTISRTGRVVNSLKLKSISVLSTRPFNSCFDNVPDFFFDAIVNVSTFNDGYE